MRLGMLGADPVAHTIPGYRPLLEDPSDTWHSRAARCRLTQLPVVFGHRTHLLRFPGCVTHPAVACRLTHLL